MHLNTYRVTFLGCEIRLSFLFNQKFNKIYYNFFNQTQSLHISMNFYTVKIVILNFGASQFLPSLNMFLCTYPQPQLKKKIPCRVRIEKNVGFKFSFITLSVCSTPIPPPSTYVSLSPSPISEEVRLSLRSQLNL